MSPGFDFFCSGKFWEVQDCTDCKNWQKQTPEIEDGTSMELKIGHFQN